MASANFTNFPRLLATAGINFNTVACKVLLVSTVPTEANLDAWVTRSQVTGEVVGTGYVAGGVNQLYTLNALDTTNNRQPITWTNLAPGWAASTISAAAAIIYANVGSAATDNLICMVDFGAVVSSIDGNFNITYTTPTYINR